ncbi:hypothetical protein [Kutzneria sp. 744]|uniref:hypothetical protein n=1 Tax=Kutzneria sp. (strain 744) TaxID=345341 RepID=UPI0003EEA7CC|nr:hypothetical protein [Kutzneria sp. 744]EWM19274.1 hypothetical protein KUTG_09578 [Kutzneria sp. 744]
MSEEWIGLDRHAKLMSWCWTGFLTAVIAAMGWAPTADSTWPDRWWVLVGFGLVWLATVVYMVNRCYGRTLLTAAGMEFHTFFSRRKIGWADVTRIEKRSHRVRGGQWWDVHAVRSQGRSLRIPGTHTTRRGDRDFDRKLGRIRKFLAAAKV